MRLLILGSNGLVGKSLYKNLKNEKFFSEIYASSRKDTNLFSFAETTELLNSFKPNIIINAAAKVGGIIANNTNRTEFILENLKININILESLISFPQIKLINLGSSCIYPLGAENPISETSLMTGKLEPTNSPYAMAKLTAIEMGDAISQQYGNNISNLMPTNLYGPGDNFSPVNSHVIPGLIFRMHKAKINNEKIFEVWGTGKPKREFLYVEDLSKAILFLIKNNHYPKILNIGSGTEVSINELVNIIKKIIQFDGKIVFNTDYPDGNPRKLLNSNLINQLGWKSSTTLEEGLNLTYNWFLDNF